MALKTQTKNQEKLAVGVGFLLIILVAVITFLRSTDFKSKKDALPQSAAAPAQEKFKVIHVPELQNKLLKKESLVLLDIRSDELYNEAHIVDSLHFPVEQLGKLSALEAGKPLFLITQTAQEENIEQVIAMLRGRGVQNIQVLDGGIENWENLNGNIITSGDPTSFANQAKVHLISAEELNDAIGAGSAFIIDTRSADAFNQGHLKGAVNIPFEELEARRNEIALNRQIVTYDENEAFGFQSAARIYDLISIPAYNLRGGLENWKNKNFELVK